MSGGPVAGVDLTEEDRGAISGGVGCCGCDGAAATITKEEDDVDAEEDKVEEDGTIPLLEDVRGSSSWTLLSSSVSDKRKEALVVFNGTEKSEWDAKPAERASSVSMEGTRTNSFSMVSVSESSMVLVLVLVMRVDDDARDVMLLVLAFDQMKMCLATIFDMDGGSRGE